MVVGLYYAFGSVSMHQGRASRVTYSKALLSSRFGKFPTGSICAIAGGLPARGGGVVVVETCSGVVGDGDFGAADQFKHFSASML